MSKFQVGDILQYGEYRVEVMPNKSTTKKSFFEAAFFRPLYRKPGEWDKRPFHFTSWPSDTLELCLIQSAYPEENIPEDWS